MCVRTYVCVRACERVRACVRACVRAQCVAFGPDSSERFATCADDGTVRVWDLSDYRVLASATCRRERARAPLDPD